MAELKLTACAKILRQSIDVLHGIDLAVKDGEFVVFVGPSGCGKSTLLRIIAGLENVTGGEVHIDGAARHPSAGVRARACHGVPVLCALSAYERAQEHGVCAGEHGAEARGHRRAGRPRRGDAAAHRLSRAQAQGAVRRPAPARRHRPRHRARSKDLSVRRAAVEPRRRTARCDAQGAGSAACRARRHHDLCHPRPGRGHDAGRPHRGAAGPAASSRSARRSNSTTAPNNPSSRASSARRA